MKAIILAAGRGSRMKRLTDDRPKCMVELHGKPLLEWQLDAIRKAGIDEIAIVTGYKNELLKKYGLIEFHNPRWDMTNMVASLSCANEWLQSDTCIVSYSDIFYESKAVESLILCTASLAVTYDPNWLELWQKRFGDPLLDAETFRMNSNNSALLEIGNKPSSVEEIQGQYMGLIKFLPNGWEEMKRVRNELSDMDYDNVHMTNILQKVIDAGNVLVEPVPYEKDWGEVDSIEDLDHYE